MMTMTNKNHPEHATQPAVPAEIARHLTDARKNLETAETHLEALEQMVVKLARGTRDVTKAAAAAKVPSSRAAHEPTLIEKVETVLRSAIASPAELASAFAVPEGRVVATIKALGKRVANVGANGTPAYSWVAGDAGPTPELNDLVERLLAVRPMTSAELIEFTGAREKRISGAIVRLQRDPKFARRLVNKGTQARGLWYLKPAK